MGELCHRWVNLLIAVVLTASVVTGLSGRSRDEAQREVDDWQTRV